MLRGVTRRAPALAKRSIRRRRAVERTAACGVVGAAGRVAPAATRRASCRAVRRTRRRSGRPWELVLLGRLRCRVDASQGGVRVRMMEDVERLLAVADLDLERATGPRVGDGHQDAVVALAPEQRHVDAV